MRNAFLTLLACLWYLTASPQNTFNTKTEIVRSLTNFFGVLSDINDPVDPLLRDNLFTIYRGKIMKKSLFVLLNVQYLLFLHTENAKNFPPTEIRLAEEKGNKAQRQGGIAQLEEHLHRTQKAVGSSPIASTCITPFSGSLLAIEDKNTKR